MNPQRPLTSSNFLNRDYCLRNSLLISFLDGSIIDLKKRLHISSQQKIPTPSTPCSASKTPVQLRKRNAYDALGNCPTPNDHNPSKKLKIENAFVWNFSPRTEKFKMDSLRIDSKMKNSQEILSLNSNDDFDMDFDIDISPQDENKNMLKDGNRLFPSNIKSDKKKNERMGSRKTQDFDFRLNFKKSEDSKKRENDYESEKNSKITFQDQKENFLNRSSYVAKCLPTILKQMQNIFQNRKNPSILLLEKKKLKCLLNDATIASSDLSGLSKFLKKFLNREPIHTSDLCLTDLELILFCLFVIKKKFKKIINPQWTLSFIEKLRGSPTQKTSEQNYKIIFKKFFKLVIQDFNKKNQLDLNNDSEFYRFHFQKISESFNQDWQNLKFKFVFNEYRNKKLSKKGRHSKKEFARVLKKSKNFMKMFQDYLDDSLMIQESQHGIFRDYWPIIEGKSRLLLERWRTKFCSNKNIKSRLCNFIVSQMQNDKIKLPWGFGEIQQAILNVERLFNRVR
jgi:hypothetical protein